MQKRLRNRIAAAEAAPATRAMLAKRSKGAAKTRAATAKLGGGATDLASLKDRPKSPKSMTATGGLPFRESLDRLTKIVEEEFDKALNKKRSLNEDGGDAMASALRGGSQGASYAGSPGDEAAALIRQAAEKDQKDLLAVATKTHSSKAIPWLKGKVQAQVAKKTPTPAPPGKTRDSNAEKTLRQARERRAAAAKKAKRAAGGGGGGQGGGRR